MKHNWKKLLAFLLLITLTIEQINLWNFNVFADYTLTQSILHSGSENSIQWTIDSEGVLNITGTGDYSRDHIGWLDFKYDITSAIVQVSGITNTSSMFEGCSNMTSIDISDLSSNNVEDMSRMFAGCSELNSIDLTKISTENVTDMSSMFADCISLKNIDFSSYNTGKVESFNSMFSGCNSLITCTINNIDTSSAKDLSFMFNNCNSLVSLDLSSWDVSGASSIQAMFKDCSKLSSINLDHWNTGNVTKMYQLFNGCKTIDSIDLSDFDATNCDDMENMFARCSSLTTIYTPKNVKVQGALPRLFYDANQNPYADLPLSNNQSIMLKSNSDTIENDGMDGTLNWSINSSGTLTIIGHGDFNTCPWLKYSSQIKSAICIISDITNTSEMFKNCSQMISVDISSLDFSQVTDMANMFQGCSKLTSIDLSAMDSYSMEDMNGVFQGCTLLSTIKTPANLTVTADLPAIYYDNKDNSYTSLPKDTLSITLSLSKDGPGDNPGGNPGNNETSTQPLETTGKPNNTTLIKVSSISLSGISKNIAWGKKLSLKANVKPYNAKNKSITWKSSNNKYATVTSNGIVKTNKAGKGKYVTITASSKDGSKKTVSYKIKIMKNAVKKIKLKGNKKLKAGKSLKLKAKIKTTGKGAYTKLVWSVSNTKYASISKKGKLKTKKAGKKKTITVYAKSLDGTNKTGKLKIKIK